MGKANVLAFAACLLAATTSCDIDHLANGQAGDRSGVSSPVVVMDKLPPVRRPVPVAADPTARTPETDQKKSPWRSLADDGLHDPTAPALGLLQQPEEALSILPWDDAGNKVNWVRALEDGHINPRTRLYPETEVETLNITIYLNVGGRTNLVRFPHFHHTKWLGCVNCHDRLFVAEAGANPISMFRILQGEDCGRCHGAVSFPLTECNRCHSVPQAELETIRARPECMTRDAKKMAVVCKG